MLASNVTPRGERWARNPQHRPSKPQFFKKRPPLTQKILIRRQGREALFERNERSLPYKTKPVISTLLET